MKIKWTNLIVFSTVVLFFLLLVKAGPEIGAFLGRMDRAGPGGATDAQVLGLFALEIVGVIAVALTVILRRRDH